MLPLGGIVNSDLIIVKIFELTDDRLGFMGPTYVVGIWL